MAGQNNLMDLNEMDEFRNEAYMNSKIYKENCKAFHDKRILRKDFRQVIRYCFLTLDLNCSQ